MQRWNEREDPGRAARGGAEPRQLAGQRRERRAPAPRAACASAAGGVRSRRGVAARHLYRLPPPCLPGHAGKGGVTRG